MEAALKWKQFVNERLILQTEEEKLTQIIARLELSHPTEQKKDQIFIKFFPKIREMTVEKLS